MTATVKELEKLYFDGTKHAVYQNIPAFVQNALGYSVEINETWRGDTARYHNLLQNLNLDQISVLGDIGANTGFFSLSLAHRFPHLKVFAYEGNNNHHRFISQIIKMFGLKNIEVKNLFVDMKGLEDLPQHDCLLNYNVLHHAGVDFDRDLVSFDSYTGYAVEYLKKLSKKATYMIFQMGFNWGGNKARPLVPVDYDAGKVLFMGKIFQQSNWEIDRIFTVRHTGEFEYFKIDASIIRKLNIKPSDARGDLVDYYSKYDISSFSEFYRRPLFYCRSRDKSGYAE